MTESSKPSGDDDDEGAVQRRTVLEQWSIGIRIPHISHGLAGEAFNRWARVTGVATAALAASDARGSPHRS